MSNVKLDRMLVFDLEETCWEGSPPPGERNEIIEIGIVELLLQGEPRIGRSASYGVRPVASQVSEFCTSLTGISPQEARRGRPLEEVLRTMCREFGGATKTWAAWGRDDESLFRDCRALGLATPPMGGYLDLGALWGMLGGAAKAPGLRRAMDALGLEFEGKPHRALDDAVNTARVAMELCGVLRLRLAPLPDGHRP